MDPENGIGFFKVADLESSFQVSCFKMPKGGNLGHENLEKTNMGF